MSEHDPGNHTLGSTLKERMRLYELIHLVKRNRRYVIFCTSLSVLGAIANQILYIPAYTAKARLEVKTAQESYLSRAVTIDIQTSGMMNDLDQVEKYVTHLKSRNFYLAVAESLRYRSDFWKLNLTKP